MVLCEVQKRDQVTIPPLDVNGLTVSDSQEKANATLIFKATHNFYLFILRRMSLLYRTLGLPHTTPSPQKT